MPNIEPAGDKLREKLGTKADWNMTLYDFERWSKVLEEMLKISILVLDRKYEHCDRLFSLEQAMYMEWHGVMTSMGVAKKWDERIKEGIELSKKKVVQNGAKMNIRFPEYVLELYRELHDFKQTSGMGIPVKTDMSSKEKMQRALE